MAALADMDADTVLLVLDRLDAAGVTGWIGGGWSVDALVGRQTRSHDDLDISFSAEEEAAAIEALVEPGFQIDPEEDLRPVRFVIRDREGHKVDLHPVVFDEYGNGLQANFEGLPSFAYPASELGSGWIGGREVACIGPELQMRFHEGYERKENDEADVAVLESLRSPKQHLGLK